MYSSVLATDMSLHFAWMARLKDFGASLESTEERIEQDDRIMLCQAIIKCADISNPVGFNRNDKESGADDRLARLTSRNIGVRCS
jgi:hypothetical protein